jgi:hypothetical protein
MNNSKCSLLVGFYNHSQYLFYKKTQVPLHADAHNLFEDNLYVHGQIVDSHDDSLSIQLHASTHKHDRPFQDLNGKLQVSYKQILIPYFEQQSIHFAGLGLYVTNLYTTIGIFVISQCLSHLKTFHTR